MPDPDSTDDADTEKKPIKGPVKIEQGFKVNGQKLNVLVQFPAQIADEIGMENVVIAANRALVTLESENHDVEKIRRTGGP